mmetsp:Transcript_22524/g.47009  ORF Transcript_22524/g.47009 Transcript_22524/m.47009 type:complete len:116 (+) Transcript_22524:1248-1595(+)
MRRKIASVNKLSPSISRMRISSCRADTPHLLRFSEIWVCHEQYLFEEVLANEDEDNREVKTKAIIQGWRSKSTDHNLHTIIHTREMSIISLSLKVVMEGQSSCGSGEGEVLQRLC